MAENSRIEWTDHTFNPWEGCQKVSPECDNCYAENRNLRFSQGMNWGPGAPRRRTSISNWNKPLRWNREADDFINQHGRRPRVFCASLADVFDNAIDPSWRDDLWEVIRQCDQIDWLLLTKRPQNIKRMLPADWGENGWDHVWLGTSAGTAKTAQTNLPHLLKIPARIRFVSAEPLLEKMDIRHLLRQGNARIHWMICGGESGPNARPMDIDAARSLRDQSHLYGIKFFFKQWGEWSPIEKPQKDEIDEDIRSIGDGNWVKKIGKKNAGRLLDGTIFNESPNSNSKRIMEDIHYFDLQTVFE